MESENLQKWKEDFQSERKKQFTKVKELQKETFQRRRAMEMKAQIEAAKEEKRRKEALAERKAQHIEATMRFQKGIKNFKINKEKISLEEVLKQISTPRSRVNSADDKTRIYNNNNNNNNNNDSTSYYSISGKLHHQQQPFQTQQQNRNTKNLKRSSSFDSLNKIGNNNNNSINNNNKYEIPRANSAFKAINSNYNIIDQYNNPNYFRPILNNDDNNNLSKIKKVTNGMNHTIENHLNNQYVSRPTTANFKDVISESQRTIQEINKEALKEFQSLIKNELNQTQSNFIYPNTTTTSNIQKPISTNTNFNSTTTKNNNIINNNSQFITSQPSPEPIKKPIETYSDVGTIITVDDVISDEDDRDTMDTDSLINARIESPELNHQKSTMNKKDGEKDDSSSDNTGTFNLVNRYGNNFQKVQNQNILNNYTDPFKNAYQTNSNTTTTTHLTNTTSTTTANNSNSNNKETESMFNINYSDYLKKNYSGNNNNTNLVTTTQHKTNEQNYQSNYESNKNNKQIKSILKRSTSLDNDSLSFFGATNPTVNFGIKPDKNVVKDSIELNNNRINANKVATKITNDNSRKKSVRFAYPEDETSSVKENNKENKEKEITYQESSIKTDLNNSNQVDLQVSVPNNTNNNSSNPVQVISDSTSTELPPSRISSTNSIRRPIIKPRNTSLNKPNGTNSPIVYSNNTNTNNNIINNNYNNNNNNGVINNINKQLESEHLKSPHQVTLEEKANDLKPPMYPLGMISPNNGYSIMNQKRREFYQRNRLIPADKQINSPKANTPKGDMSPTLGFHQNLPINYSDNSKPNENEQKNTTYNQHVSLLNRQLHSPLQQYTENNNNQIQTNQIINKNVSKTPTSTLISNNNNNNNNNNINDFNNHHHPSTNMTFSNFKYNENFYRDYQITKLKSELNHELNPNINIDPKLKLNHTDPGIFNQLNAQKLGENIFQNTQPQPGEQYSLTRIPLSPKSNIQKSYFSPNDKQLININGVEQIGLRRPFSATSSNIKEHQSEQNLINGPKSNIRFAYLNSNHIINNHLQSGRPSSPNAVPRVLSADNINRHIKNQNQAIQLDIKYPLYSNYQAQTHFINITKPLRPNHNDIDPNKEVADSMALFLKAEEMSAKHYTESQILNTVQDFKNKTPIRNNPSNLSIEEQNIKNSILRLNERLNLLSNQQNRYNHDDINKKKVNNTSNNGINKLQRPISANAFKLTKK